MPDLTDSQAAEIRSLLLAGNKIEAIKTCRAHTGLDLTETKTLIDQLETSLRAEHPEKFPAKKSGCAPLLCLLLLAGTAALLLSQPSPT